MMIVVLEIRSIVVLEIRSIVVLEIRSIVAPEILLKGYASSLCLAVWHPFQYLNRLDDRLASVSSKLFLSTPESSRFQ